MKMGFNGNYLFEQHTRRHVRELWKAQLGETGTIEAWKSAGAKSTVQKAQEKVAEILAAEPAGVPGGAGARVRRHHGGRPAGVGRAPGRLSEEAAPSSLRF